VPLQIGIVGLPNAGKSTLFNALTRGHAAVASYPFTTIEPHIGVAAVPDERLEAVAALIRPTKVVPTTVQFVDIAGLVRGAHRGEGLGNQFLAAIREVDAIAVVLRCFVDADIPHMSEALSPVDDLAVLDLELSLADLATVERRVERTRGAAKASPKEHEWELAALVALQQHLAGGQPARTFPGGTSHASASPPSPRRGGADVWGNGDTGTPTGARGKGVAHLPKPSGATDDPIHLLMSELFLLTNKPRLLVANVGEDSLPAGGPLAAQVIAAAASEGSQAVALCAECEAALAEWTPEEAATYRAELGLTEAGLLRLVHASYRLLDLITFFTVTGGEVVRAWTLRRGMTAWHAAGQVHTDIQRGFVRADVVRHSDLLAAGSMTTARESGKLRSEGRDYVVQDGDVIHVHFVS
jgi:ribosome-binding ATPase